MLARCFYQPKRYVGFPAASQLSIQLVSIVKTSSKLYCAVTIVVLAVGIMS